MRSLMDVVANTGAQPKRAHRDCKASRPDTFHISHLTYPTPQRFNLIASVAIRSRRSGRSTQLSKLLRTFHSVVGSHSAATAAG